MAKIMLTNEFSEDERWLTAGANAMALFIDGLRFANRAMTDGRIAKGMLPRLSLAVAVDDVNGAIDALLASGFWVEDESNYWVVDYAEYCFTREEQLKTQEYWRVSKQRSRWHRIGNHELCNPEKCRGAAEIKSNLDSTLESRVTSTDNYPTRHNPTRHDPTLREGGVEVGEATTQSPPLVDVDGVGFSGMEHAFSDDGSGLSCAACELPAEHAGHRNYAVA